jgi:predicted amidohydrolase
VPSCKKRQYIFIFLSNLNKEKNLILKIAAHQISFQSNKVQNLKKILNIIQTTKAQLHIFPEYSMGLPKNGITSLYVKENAEYINENFVTAILKKTQQKKTTAIFTIYLKEKNQIYNAAILARNGKIKTIYKKIHLFDAFGYKESDIFSPGNNIALASVNGFKVGLAICFDLRFPELFRVMAHKGAELFAIPSAWYLGENKIEQWNILTKARSHENNSYLVAVNQALPKFTGYSIIASPSAKTIKQAKTQEKTLVAYLDKQTIKEAKKLIPTIHLSKPKLYKKLQQSKVS